jgi:hypothetical protein
MLRIIGGLSCLVGLSGTLSSILETSAVRVNDVRKNVKSLKTRRRRKGEKASRENYNVAKAVTSKAATYFTLVGTKKGPVRKGIRCYINYDTDDDDDDSYYKKYNNISF